MTPEKLHEAFTDPRAMGRLFMALADEQEKRATLEAENAVMKPKARFADAVACADTDIPVGELAKILRGNGVDIGEKRLFEWMRENKYLMRCRGDRVHVPTQHSMDLRLFRVTETAETHSDGHVTINRTAMVTEKGQQYFINYFLSNM